MNKLLSLELKRAISSPLLWLGACILIGLNVFGMVLSTYGFTITASTFLFQNISIICICLAIFIALHIGLEFEARTINNKIIADYSRKQIYIAELSVSVLCGFLFLLMDIGSILVISKITKLSLGVSVTNLVIESIICFVCISTIAALFTMIAMLLHKRLYSIAACLCIALLCLNLGGNAVSALNQEEYRIVDGEQQIENVLYLDGFMRTATNVHVLVSPFAQVKYQPYANTETPVDKAKNSLLFKNASHHYEFPLINLLELFGFTWVGMVLFRKQDFK